jgi:hypothetical protein
LDIKVVPKLWMCCDNKDIRYVWLEVCLLGKKALWDLSRILSKKMTFDVHGSIHLGNVYVQLKVQLDTHGFVCILYFTIFALHALGAICTHHQEHKQQSTAIGTCNGYGM